VPLSASKGARENVDERRLAGAVGAHQSDDFARLDGKACARQRTCGAEGFIDGSRGGAAWRPLNYLIYVYYAQYRLRGHGVSSFHPIAATAFSLPAQSWHGLLLYTIFMDFMLLAAVLMWDRQPIGKGAHSMNFLLKTVTAAGVAAITLAGAHAADNAKAPRRSTRPASRWR
jgi:hypothetical protein